MNSRWRANRIGLIDFWYYDEEEFYFLDGRILLRGANGSGKSVTMQSFIPLLLDGNMRPERLDPFGSKARKMENYLLEEGDGRDERTGYLYMEFKRQEADNYITIGIGMRARRNKKMDVWYFAITDGRRIGEDFFLYKDVNNKIAYSKQELKNRIAEGGKFFDSQREYAEYVNKMLFGFETTDEYKEMLELLIQLRTPKLSKDFKPTIINEILSSSLQTLTEDDLRPMSEAIENMDSLKTMLDTLKESIQAARQIERVFGQYNSVVLYDKAKFYKNAADDYDYLIKQAQDYKQQKDECTSRLDSEQEKTDKLIQEQEILLEEKKSLDENDATKLKEEEQTVLSELRVNGQSLDEKEKQHQDKRQRRIDIENKINIQKSANEQSSMVIDEFLEEMGEHVQDFVFDEFEFLKRELSENRERVCDFKSHKHLLNDYCNKVEAGIDVLENEKNCKREYDEQLIKTDELLKERDHAEREFGQADILFSEAKSDWLEKVYKWNRENKELNIASEGMQILSRVLEDFKHGEDFSEIKESIKTFYQDREDELREEQRKAIQHQDEIAQQYEEKKSELSEWEEKKDAEPLHSQAVIDNRKFLDENNIPYVQFYKAVDFDKSLSDEQASCLEEALLNMGILDALIISEEYRERVLDIDEGLCDKYIFTDVNSVKDNLLNVLDIDNADNDINLYQNVYNVLSSVGSKDLSSIKNSGEIKDISTWIAEDGKYRLGILEGTVTRQHKAKYIGAKARERYRMQEIERLKGECDFLKEELSFADKECERKAECLKQIKGEWNKFPAGDDVKTAARVYSDKEYELGLLQGQVEKQREKLEELRKQLEQIHTEVLSVCKKTYFTIRLDVFKTALKAIGEYKNSLTGLEIEHERFLNGIESLKVQNDYLEEVEADIDNILYDINKSKHKIEELKSRIESIQEQLKLTNYEEIKERLDYCITRLKQIPKEREKSAEEKGILQQKIEELKTKISDSENRIIQKERIKECCEKAFSDEIKLWYVKSVKEYFNQGEDKKSIASDIYKAADKVLKLLAEEVSDKRQSDLLSSFQEIYHQNRGFLLGYNLTLKNIFEETEEEIRLGLNIHRIDIEAKYRGTPLPFNELLEKLIGDMDTQSKLISEKDREIFEDILANTIIKKIRARIQASKKWVERMNEMMESMQTSSGLKLSLKWKNKRADNEEQMDTKTLVELLQKDSEIMREEEIASLSMHFRSKIQEARKLSDETYSAQSFYMIIKEVLDYRKWFEFQIECQKTGEKKKELTDRVFFTFSGGEKAMAMYVPLFSAVAAKYAGARQDAPRLISLDEAFAGVDEMNIKDMFRLMVEFEFDFMINSQILWGDYETIPKLAIYHLIRPENAKYVSVITYVWNGKGRVLVKRIGDEIED